MVAVAVLYETKDCREGHLKETTCRTIAAVYQHIIVLPIGGEGI